MAAKPILDPYGRAARNSIGYGSTRRHFRQLDAYPAQREAITHQPFEPGAAHYRNARNAGREIYNEYPVARGLVNEIARFITGKVSRQYVGADPAWGEIAEDHLNRTDAYVDLRGRGYDADLLRFDLARLPFSDNAVGALLTENSEGAAKVQLIPDDWIKTVLRNDYGTVTGYEIEGRDAPVSVNDLILNFVPGYHCGGRAISPLAIQRWAWLDLGEWQRAELMAARLLGTRGLVIKNDLGEAVGMPGADLDGITDDTTPIYERVEAAGIEYLKTSHSIEAFDPGSRPSMNFQAFTSKILAQIFWAMGWDIDSSLEARESGGASIRISADRTRNTARWYFDHMVRRPWARIDSYRLAKAAKNGLIPYPTSFDDYFAWKHVGGLLVTADRKYQAETDVYSIDNKIESLQDVMAGRGKDWRDHLDQTTREAMAAMDEKLKAYRYAEQLAGGDERVLAHILGNEIPATNQGVN